MNKKDFWFELPEQLIAQSPIKSREQSRLLRLDKNTGKTYHHRFYQLPELLQPGDCVVMNDSRVLPARLLGKRETGGAVEVVLLRDMGDGLWECMTRPGKKTRQGTKLFFSEKELSGIVVDVTQTGNRLVKFSYDGVFLEVLEKLGKMPLPPYIREELDDPERYQTVYSKERGSAAAPTAGLHFTKELLEQLKIKGVELCYITLHVGLGTFRPVKEDVLEKHVMHSEYFTISEEAAGMINKAKRSKGRVIAVGTTSCRALEAATGAEGAVEAYTGFTDIFIYPGYEFKCIDGLITNFHLPESTLIMLVSALAGREKTLEAYSEAIREKYRFYSFGDAMLILP